jgi:hypothetical protein
VNTRYLCQFAITRWGQLPVRVIVSGLQSILDNSLLFIYSASVIIELAVGYTDGFKAAREIGIDAMVLNGKAVLLYLAALILCDQFLKAGGVGFV